MAHLSPSLRDSSQDHEGLMAGGAEQLRIANEDVEGIFRGFTGGEAAVTAAIGCIAGMKLLTVETRSSFVNTAARMAGAGLTYLGIKAAERTAEVGVQRAQQAVKEFSIATVS